FRPPRHRCRQSLQIRAQGLRRRHQQAEHQSPHPHSRGCGRGSSAAAGQRPPYQIALRPRRRPQSAADHHPRQPDRGCPQPLRALPGKNLSPRPRPPRHPREDRVPRRREPLRRQEERPYRPADRQETAPDEARQGPQVSQPPLHAGPSPLSGVVLYFLTRRKPMKKLVPLILMGAAPFVAAESVNSPWSGEGDLAFSKSSGNTRNESLLAKLMVAYTDGRWTHSGQLEAVNASEDDSRSAEAYVLRGKTQYALDDRYYAFGNGRYQDDRFSGYEYQASLVGGVGVHVIATERALFDLEAGAGYRRSEEQDAGETFNEPVLLLASKYHRELTETTRFENDLSVESGADN